MTYDGPKGACLAIPGPRADIWAAHGPVEHLALGDLAVVAGWPGAGPHPPLGERDDVQCEG